jgi:hypothetical protein
MHVLSDGCRGKDRKQQWLTFVPGQVNLQLVQEVGDVAGHWDPVSKTCCPLGSCIFLKNTVIKETLENSSKTMGTHE